MGLLTGKIAAVTASTRGIGLASARRLAAEGAKVYLAARNAERAQAVIDEIVAAGGAAAYVRFDAADKSTYAGFVREVVEAEGRIDVLVNNYGSTDVTRDHDIADTDFEAMQEIVMDDVRSVWDSTQQAVRAMKDTGPLAVVNIASTAGLYPDLARESYGLAKDLVIRLTKDAAIQYARQGVRANAICPGCIATDAVRDNMSEEFTRAFLSTVPLGRLGEPEDIANAVLFFASDMSAYVTGNVMEVSGGSGLGTPLYPLYQMMETRG